MTTSPPPVEDQARLLEDALTVVRQQTVQMKRCLESPGKLMDALKCRYAAIEILTYYQMILTYYPIVRHSSQNCEQAV